MPKRDDSHTVLIIGSGPIIIGQACEFDYSRTQQQVRAEIERILDQDLPISYEQAEFKQKCNNVFKLVFDYANRQKRWAA